MEKEIWKPVPIETAELKAEIERLREACQLWVAYDEGDQHSGVDLMLDYDCAITATRAALQPKEGEQ
jgi:hypothetical protein